MTCWPRSHFSNVKGPVPVGCAVAYSLKRTSSSVPETLSASNFFIAVGLCIENAGSDIACTKPAKGSVSTIVALVAPSAVQDL